MLAEELGPFLFDQVAVGLQRPAHPLVLTALLHPRDERMEEVKAGQGGLAALEGERNVRITRHGECTVDDGTCHVFAHDAGAPLLAMSSDIAVKAVPAPHVASTRCRFYQKANMLRAHGTYPPSHRLALTHRAGNHLLTRGGASGPHNHRMNLRPSPGAPFARPGTHAPPGRAAAGQSCAVRRGRPCRRDY